MLIINMSFVLLVHAIAHTLQQCSDDSRYLHLVELLVVRRNCASFSNIPNFSLGHSLTIEANPKLNNQLQILQFGPKQYIRENHHLDYIFHGHDLLMNE